MSLELWNEFASPKKDLLENPWSQSAHEVNQRSSLEEDDFGDFESPRLGSATERAQLAYKEANGQGSIKDNDFGDFESPGLLFTKERSDVFAPTIDHLPETSQLSHASVNTAVPKSTYDASLEDFQLSPIGDNFPSLVETHPLKQDEYPPSNRKILKSPCLPFGASHVEKKEIPMIPTFVMPANEDDTWDDFIDGPVCLELNGAKGEGYAKIGSKASDSMNSLHNSPNSVKVILAPKPAEAIQVQSPPGIKGFTRELPPSNVPPPSVLLPLIINTFQTLLVNIKNILLSTGSQFLLNEQALIAIHNYLSVARAAARIIAGRKLRWRRDSRLSQSMKIGPAHAGKPGGMKLTGLDRMENRREDGEVEEAVRTWKHQMGSLRSVVASAKSRQPSLNLALPEISESMPIRVAKSSEGALLAPSSCFLCGLKREERIEQVDGKVEDSFEEWWLDHWGHIDCIFFWEKQKNLLKQR